MENQSHEHGVQGQSASPAAAALRVLGLVCCLIMGASGIVIVARRLVRIFYIIPTHVLALDRPEEYRNDIVTAIFSLVMVFLAWRWSQLFRATRLAIPTCPKEATPVRADLEDAPRPSTTSESSPSSFGSLFAMVLGLLIAGFAWLLPILFDPDNKLGPADTIAFSLIGLVLIIYSSSRLIQRLEANEGNNQQPHSADQEKTAPDSDK